MRLGLIARADNTGLGNQTYQFYKHMKPFRTMVVDISGLNGNEQHPERYSEGEIVHINGFPDRNDINAFLQDLDCVFVAESPYNYYLYQRAKELDVKVAVQYNYEFFDWYEHPDFPKPDMLIAPSMWHYWEIDPWAFDHNIKHVYLHCPVNRDELPVRDHPQARSFLHVAGKPAAYDRNGTETVIEAARYLKTDAQITIHFQGDQGLEHQATHSITELQQRAAYDNGHHLTIRTTDFKDYRDIYAGADVLILPRRYGGNCLPMNEALSCGMPAIMPKISPNDDFLPEAWLLPATLIGQFQPRTTVDIYAVDPQILAERIDFLYNLSETQYKVHTVVADSKAQEVSWETMAPKYEAELRLLCSQ